MKKISVLLFLLYPLLAVSQPAHRIVSLDLCSDWMLARYAERANILALSSMIHRYPVEWVGTQWPTHDGSLEQILALEPDVVLTGEYNAITLRERLRELGVRVEVLPLPRRLADIVPYEQQFLAAIGMPPDLASRPAAPADSRKKTRLLLLGANGIGTGRQTLEDDILQYAGWQNYITHEGYVNLDLENLVSDAPDAVLWSAPLSAALANQFAEHPVLKKTVSKEHWLSTDYWSWSCPGPWTWTLIEQLRQWQER